MGELNALHQAILALAATQEDGFEGLVGDLLAEVTGQQFRLMKSGPQGGIDAAGKSTTGFAIGVEGKRYGSKTKLPLDQLKSKVRDAAEQFSELDLWVLATTRSVSYGDAVALEKAGARDGIDVLVLDWNVRTLDPPALAVLCAMAPLAVQRRLKSSIELDRDIAWVRAHARFEAVSGHLVASLCLPEVGYAAARTAMAEWLRSRLEQDDRAWLAFNSQRAALLHADAHLILRPGVSSALDQWWSNAREKLYVVQGDEGHGKTWAALGWWLHKDSDGPDFPLTVVVPAKQVQTADADTVIAGALYSALKTRDAQFWRRRVQRWLDGGSSAPRMLVILDGLNQNWTFSEWQELFVSMAGAERRGKVAVLLTARPDFLRTNLRELQGLTLESLRFDLQPFSDEEVAQVLKSYGLEAGQFDGALLAMLRVPRLCHRAVRRKRELENSGDITPERLVYEDWRDRQPEAMKRMSDEEFRTFLADIARQISSDPSTELSRKYLLEQLTLQSGEPPQDYRSVLSEVVDGRWLEATERPNMFRVHPDKLPYALGLSLVHELRTVTDSQQACAVIHTALDVHQGSDYSVRILRCAGTLAMTEATVSEPVRQAILAAWIESQNFGTDDFDALWKCLGHCPESILDVAQNAWFGATRRSGHDDVVLYKAIANAAQWAPVMRACEMRLTSWFSGYWADPFVGEFINEEAADERALARRESTRIRAAEWGGTAGARAFDLALEEVEPAGRAWGCYRAIELLSWLPRLPMLRPITAWAITRGIMGMLRQEGMISWLLRWNQHDSDDLQRALLARAAELSQLGPVGYAAAQALLRALATPSADRALRALVLSADPAADAREVDSSHGDSMQAGPDDPRLRLSAIDDETIRQALLMEPSAAYARTIQDLVQCQSGALREHARRQIYIILQELEIDPCLTKEASVMLPALRRLHLLLEPDDIARWKEVARRARTSGADWNWDLQVGALLCETAVAQIELLDAAPRTSNLAPIAGVLSPLDSDAAAALNDRLAADRAEEELLFWLDYVWLASSSDKADTPSANVATLFPHPSSKVREKALRAALLDDTGVLADALAVTSWTWRTAPTREERALGSILLAKARNGDHGSLVSRVHPEALGRLVDRYPDQDIYLSNFAEHVRAELYELRSAKSRSFPRALLQDRQGWQHLVDSRADDLEQWLLPFLEQDSRRLIGLWHESFPLIRAIEAISTKKPELAASLFAKLFEDETTNGFRSGDLHAIGIKLNFEQAEGVRQHVLNRANTDDKLFDLVLGLYRSKQLDRLHKQIRDDTRASMAGHIARGLTMAGFLVPAAFGDEFWAQELRTLPPGGWLRDVAKDAFARYRRARDCLQAFDRFETTAADGEAFECFELLASCVDARFFVSPQWMQRRSKTWTASRRLHWSQNSVVLKERCKTVSESLKKTFLCSEPPLYNQHPARW